MELLRYAGNPIARGLAQLRLGVGGVLMGLFTVGCLSAAPEAEVHLNRFEFSHPAMGTQFRIVLFAESQAKGAAAATAAFDRIDEIERLATDYDAASEARGLSRATTAFEKTSADLGHLLLLSESLYRDSEGAFDPTVGALTREWRRSFRQREWPRVDRWEAAAAAVGFGELVDLRVNEVPPGPSDVGIRLRREGMRLDLGGVAKGYAVDAAIDVMAELGVQRALVDGGGDVAAREPPPGQRGWQVTVAPLGDDPNGPRLRFLLARGAVATSGDAYQGVELEGEPLPGLSNSAARFGHVIDARTRLPLESPRAAVMVAPTAAEADGWATALMVLGEEGIRSASRGHGVPSLNTSPLRRGIFFGGGEAEPCVGDSFPHDGYVHLTPPSE